MAGLATDPATWGLLEGVSFLRRDWGDETVIYNATSGETHLLDAFSDWVLRELEREPATIAGLAEHYLEGGDSEEVRQRVEMRIAEVLSLFDDEGLAEPLRE